MFYGSKQDGGKNGLDIDIKIKLQKSILTLF